MVLCISNIFKTIWWFYITTCIFNTIHLINGQNQQTNKYILIEESKTYADAISYCQSNYGTGLATIGNANDNLEGWNLCGSGVCSISRCCGYTNWIDNIGIGGDYTCCQAMYWGSEQWNDGIPEWTNRFLCDKPPTPTGCVNIRSITFNKYVTSEGNSLYQPLKANRDWKSDWERFDVTYDSGSGNYYLRSMTWDRYWQARPDGSLNCGRNGVSLGAWERFDIGSCGTGCFTLRSEAFNKYVVAENDPDHTLKANRDAVGDWEKFEITSCV